MPCERALELAEARAAVGEIADHEQRPLAADDVGGPADGTVGVRHEGAVYRKTSPTEVAIRASTRTSRCVAAAHDAELERAAGGVQRVEQVVDRGQRARRPRARSGRRARGPRARRGCRRRRRARAARRAPAGRRRCACAGRGGAARAPRPTVGARPPRRARARRPARAPPRRRGRRGSGRPRGGRRSVPAAARRGRRAGRPRSRAGAARCARSSRRRGARRGRGSCGPVAETSPKVTRSPRPLGSARASTGAPWRSAADDLRLPRDRGGVAGVDRDDGEVQVRVGAGHATVLRAARRGT